MNALISLRKQAFNHTIKSGKKELTLEEE